MNLGRIKVFLHDSSVFLLDHLFIATTGTAALIHSTWSLATFFNGKEPEQGSGAWWGWVVPAFLLAVSIDVGQIATSSQIANGNRSRAKYATFGVLALATYYLQWLYIAHHLPLITLGAGVNPGVASFAGGVRDIALWLLPAMLPASTLLYTFSYGKAQRKRTETLTIKTSTQTEMRVERPAANQSAPQLANPSQLAIAAHSIQCDECDWRGSYALPRSATNALVAHRRHAHPSNSIRQ